MLGGHARHDFRRSRAARGGAKLGGSGAFTQHQGIGADVSQEVIVQDRQPAIDGQLPHPCQNKTSDALEGMTSSPDQGGQAAPASMSRDDHGRSQTMA